MFEHSLSIRVCLRMIGLLYSYSMSQYAGVINLSHTSTSTMELSIRSLSDSGIAVHNIKSYNIQPNFNDVNHRGYEKVLWARGSVAHM